jgi:hypothetical protein
LPFTVGICHFVGIGHSEIVTAMLRPRIESALAKLLTLLTVLTLVWPAWIEKFTGYRLDAGNGDAEWAIVILFAVLALIAALMARRDHRLAEQRGARPGANPGVRQ